MCDNQRLHGTAQDKEQLGPVTRLNRAHSSARRPPRRMNAVPQAPAMIGVRNRKESGLHVAGVKERPAAHRLVVTAHQNAPECDVALLEAFGSLTPLEEAAATPWCSSCGCNGVGDP